MRIRLLALATLAAVIAALPAAALPQAPAPDCQPWQECRQLALDARARGEYERFHDFAWRAIQTGPPNDPALMYLLARAQSLSGRRRDALVMLRRLADMGVPTSAATEEDLRRTRELPGWSALERAFERLEAGAPGGAAAGSSSGDSPAPAPSSSAAAAAVAPSPVSAAVAPASAPTALAVEQRPIEEVARLSGTPFVPGGVAYDAVSRRFVLGDSLGRRLVVLGEGSSRINDLVRGDAAGFHDITALEIDPRRGDLWVTSTAPAGGAGAIHKLQLISGRVIAMHDVPSGAAGASLVDLSVAANGTVLMLDSAAALVLGLRPGAEGVEVLMPLGVADPVSIAAAGSERVAYVAHGDGIVRVDLQTQRAMPIAAPNGVLLGGFERIRWHRESLVGIQMLPDGSRAVIVLQLNRGGQAVTAARQIDTFPGDGARPVFASVSGDDLYYTTADRPSSAKAGAAANVVVRRVRLR